MFASWFFVSLFSYLIVRLVLHKEFEAASLRASLLLAVPLFVSAAGLGGALSCFRQFRDLAKGSRSYRPRHTRMERKTLFDILASRAQEYPRNAASDLRLERI